FLACCVSSRRRHTRSKRDWSSDVCSSDLYRGFKRVGNTISEVRSTYKESFVEEEEITEDIEPVVEEAIYEQNDSFNEYEDYSREEVSYVSKQRPQRRGLFDKIKNKFNVNDAEETTEQWQPRYQPSIKVDKEPSWEVYDDTDALASTAASERARLERDKDLVLDLDYFDQIS